MSLRAGLRLGPYEILGPIGSGGMGEVYRARDTRLRRDVAVKVLPGEVSHTEERLHRFEQEARLAGSLNHPNVLTVFDVGTREGAPYLVTELLEGHSLREVLAAGPVPCRKATDYAQQIARGLAAAHEHGVVHRDLKPANVFVTRDGRVKILDFGLAKLTREEPGVAALSQLSTDTAEGTVAGTVGYMSPEQVRGHPVDARSDIFALGAVAFEMLSGRQAFAGDSPADAMTAILTKDPQDLSRPGLEVPAGLERIVRRCLEKDPEERFQAARDVAYALEAESGTSHLEPSAVASSRRRMRWIPAGLVGAALVAAAAGTGFIVGRRIREPLPRTTQLTFRRGVIDVARFAPDGRTVVYSALWDGGPPEIFTTRVERPESRSLGLPPARLMGVSSRGELAILLMAPGDRSDGPGTLARVPLVGGEPRRLIDGVQAADWSPDGQELAILRHVEGQLQLEYPIGNVLARDIVDYHLRVSPRGDRVAVGLVAGVDVYGRTGGRTTIKTPPVTWGFTWASDEAIWVTGGERQDARSLWLATPSAPPREVYRSLGTMAVQDASTRGRLLVHHGFERVGIRGKPRGDEAERDLAVLNWSWVADLSADGQQLLVREGAPQLPLPLMEPPLGRSAVAAYVRPLGGGPAVRLGDGVPLALSPDGEWALIASFHEGPRFSVTPTGAGEPRPLPLEHFEKIAAAWFPDDERVVVDAAVRGRPLRTFVQDVSGGEPRPVTPEGVVSVRGSCVDERLLGVTPDGKLAFYPIGGGDPHPTPARIPAGATILRASGDGRFVFVSRGGVPWRIDRLEVATGRLGPWKVLQPDDLTGVPSVGEAALSANGDAYAYTYGRYFEDLFLVEGLRF
jgi:hypothetical protein